MANSFSNLITIFLGLYGGYVASQQKLPTRYPIGFLGVAVVGIGSFAFHASLLYEAQLADELPMVVVASYSLFILSDSRKGFDFDAGRGVIPLVAFNTLFPISYAIYRNPIYHQTVFATLMACIVLRTLYLIHSDISKNVPPVAKKRMGKIYQTGLLTFLTGFAIWNLDNIYCNTLTEWKNAIGWPIAFLLEGHSWWHALTAIGSYLMMLGTTFPWLSRIPIPTSLLSGSSGFQGSSVSGPPKQS
ncbi:alkaline phytoceramidase, partial [Thelephora ganbajun]